MIPVTSEAQEKITVSREARQKLPLLGTARLGLTKPDVIGFGNVYQGVPIRGRVAVHNHTGSDLLIRKVTTTCGCTVAYPESSSIAKSGSTEVLLELVPKKAERFGVKVRILTESGEHEFRVTGNCRPRLIPKSRELNYTRDDEFIQLCFTVIDSSVDAKTLKISLNGKHLEQVRSGPNEIVYRIPTALIKPSAYTNIQPIFGDRPGSVIPIRIQESGVSRLVTDLIYGSGQPFSFKLFVTGDIPFENGAYDAKLLVDGEEHIAKLKVLAKKRTALIQCRCEKPVSGQAKLFVGTGEYSFTLTER